MKRFLVIPMALASLTIALLPARAEVTESVINNMRFFITSDNLLIAANIKSGSACSLNKGTSITKMAGFKAIYQDKTNARVSGRVESFLALKNNEIYPVAGKFQSNAKVRTADWLIRNTEYYPEFLSEMVDCTTEGGLRRMQFDSSSP
ncbi:hypothetical protein H6G74_12395 [Nostoc spongiaeforme FACHB-130]|uniref:Uncharacterized protein n=1 Tax=Nostoc spongiaeforme FACHB-130 TaxID=1357510 RepID=A0ABR8FUJ4_9NOSO|nr:hypothetical protein [Nostoc spongiaeforme]MBD2595126.1 hypothetical protein [Nostoc spongiaeforme FACHB-130]